MSATLADSTERTLNRALPPWAVDAILFGLPGRDGRDSRRVWGKCVSIAMSAYRRGWSETDYVNEVARNESALWVQLMTRSDGRRSSLAAAHKALQKAWAAGVTNANDVAERTKEDIRADAVERAFTWSDRLTDGLDGLNAKEAAVMQYVITETERRGMLRVTCPGRVVAEHAKLSHRTAVRTLSALTNKGLLVRHSRGRPGKDGTGKAGLYGLSDPGYVN